MTDDIELLRRYARDRSEEAFAELVRRQVNFVYACALPRVGGDEHLARDVSQQVFIALARQAHALVGRTVLAGWLYTTTRFIAAKAVRTERRRRGREQGAQQMSELSEPSSSGINWDGLQPVISQAMDDLNEQDRMAVLLRFFKGYSFAEIGAKLNLSEEGARSRVDRTLAKMRRSLSHRGFNSTAAALTGVLASRAALVAPNGLAGSITMAALSAPAIGVGPGMAFELLKFMTTAKTITGVAGVVAALSILGNVYQSNRAQLATASLGSVTLERDDFRVRLTAANTKIAQLETALAASRGGQEGRSVANSASAPIPEAAVRLVSIQGAVKNPGRYELPPGSAFSVIELLAKAGGFTDIAKGSDVRITHASGANSVQHVDVQGIITGKSDIAPYDDSLLLKPGDIVYVPEKLI